MIYLSTGHFQTKNFYQTALFFKKNNISNIEFSGGKFTKNINIKLKKLKKKQISFIFHNYFPVPKKSFIINLASSTDKIHKLSVNHFKKVIDISSLYKIKYVSMHAGFKVNFLKNSFKINHINEVNIIDNDKAEKNFLKSIRIISKYAKKKNIRILIENNVLSKKNYLLFKSNPFLFSESKSINKIMKDLPKNVGLILDTGHLKVTCKTLGLNLSEEYKKVFKHIKAYHLSDNNGLADTNNLFTKNAWWFKKFKKKLDYYTIEVYDDDLSKLKKQVSIVEKKINTKKF